jgi:hypothetical protein
MTTESEPTKSGGEFDEAQSGGHGSWLLPAIVTGMFGLGGVLAGGAVSWKVQEHALDNQNAREALADRKIALGTARLMDVEFRWRVAAMKAALEPDRYPLKRISLSTRLAASDQRAVASAMRADDWSAVAAALSRLGGAQRLLDRHPGQRLSDRDLQATRAYKALFQTAAQALARFEAKG